MPTRLGQRSPLWFASATMWFSHRAGFVARGGMSIAYDVVR